MRPRATLRLQQLEDRYNPSTFTVTSLADSGTGTLRSAIALAEADATPDTIVFDSTLRGGTISLTTFDTGLNTDQFGPAAFYITTAVTIQGDGQILERAAQTPAFRLFAVLNNSGAGKLSLSNLELSGGLAQGGSGEVGGGGGAGGFGGAIYNAGQLTLTSVTLSNNTSQGGNGGAQQTNVSGGGGGVGASSTGSEGGGPNGGGVGLSQDGGYGGGGASAVEGDGGNGGFGGGGGGGSFGGGGGAGGFGGGGGGGSSSNDGIGGYGAGSGLNGAGGGGAGMGGGIFNDKGTVSITNSTFTGNSAIAGTGGSNTALGLGGGLFNYNGTVTVMSSTFSTNTASGGGQQIYALGQFSGAANVATTDITNTILGQADTLVTDFVGTTDSSGTSLTAGSGNLIRSSTGYAGGVVSTANPLLGTLAANGGLTRTLLPQSTSPVLDALDATAAGSLTSDQRGLSRVANGRLDIGAVEIQATSPPPSVTRTYAVGVGNDVQIRSVDGILVKTIACYTPRFSGGLSVAYGDVTGDGVRDIITGAGASGDPHVIVTDGVTNKVLYSFYAFRVGFLGGVSVAVADLDGSGKDSIIVGAGPGGGPHVKVYSIENGQLVLVKSFYAFAPYFTGGVSVGGADGRLEVGAGPGGGPHVKVFLGLSDTLVSSFYALSPGFAGGISVALGDLNGDGVPDIVAGAKRYGGPHVVVYDGAHGNLLQSFYAYSPWFLGGVNVALEDTTGSGQLNLLFGAGPGGGPHVILRDGRTLALFSSYYAVSSTFEGGVTVA